jgi:hypothetical protein
MIEYGRQRSTVKPLEVDVLETKVFVANNITQISENIGEDNEFTGYEFDLTEYIKDEYIQVQTKQNKELKDNVTSMQMALCEVYEML